MQLSSGKWAKIIVHLSLFIILFLVACTSAAPVPARLTTERGIPVADEFAAFYAANDGERVFGQAITEGFVGTDDGRFTQYFQTMRLELEGNAVVIYPLGNWALAGVNELVPAPLPDNSALREFPDTDFTVQDEFLAFYDEFDGETLLGLPISAQLNEGNLRVQYLENGRLEWRPELPLGHRIQVSHLGQAHFDTEMAFAYRKSLLAQPVVEAGIDQVDVFTSVEAAVLYAGDEQTLYVTTLSPEGRPVSGVSIEVTILYGDDATTISLGQTDANGHIAALLPTLTVSPGEIVQLQTAVYSSNGDLLGSDSLSFKTWW